MQLRSGALVAVLSVIVMGGLASAPAYAASATHTAQSVAAPTKLLGTRCVTVHSNVHRHAAVICVGVDIMGTKADGMVTFKAKSGVLREVSFARLELIVNGAVVEKIGPVQSSGGGTYLNWWDEPSNFPAGHGRAAVKKACVFWRGGGRACTGRHWFYSKRVFV
jgi:hypothetical protein